MPDHRVEIRAKTRIREGEEITNEYLKPETGTLLRREVINTKWFFYCSCPRCRDPTELGETEELLAVSQTVLQDLTTPPSSAR